MNKMTALHHQEEDMMLYWIVIFGAIALIASGFGFSATGSVAFGTALALLLVFVLRQGLALASRALRS